MGGKCACCNTEDISELKICTSSKECASHPLTESTATFPLASLRDVLTLQSAVKTYLTGKALERVYSSLIVMEQSEESDVVQRLNSTPIRVVPDMLSEAAKDKMKRLEPFEYRLRVVGGDYVGPVMFSDGSVYDGQWKNGKRFGRGRFFTSSGGLLEGYWNSGLHLHGRIIYPNGDHYEGQYHHMHRSGAGLFQSHHFSSYYDGQWLSDQKHGYGEEKTGDGMEYKGWFVGGVRQGEGRLVFENGDVYEGNFFKNKHSGEGKYIWASSGKTYDGQWEDGQMHGKGSYLSRGKEYVGGFVHGKKEGWGVLTIGETKYEGEFKANKKHGSGTVTTNGGPPEHCQFVNNRRVSGP